MSIGSIGYPLDIIGLLFLVTVTCVYIYFHFIANYKHYLDTAMSQP